jgi:hypothetical protein
LTIVAGAPLGFILSLLGIIRDRDRKPAVVGLIVSGALVALFFLTALC